MFYYQGTTSLHICVERLILSSVPFAVCQERFLGLGRTNGPSMYITLLVVCLSNIFAVDLYYLSLSVYCA